MRTAIGTIALLFALFDLPTVAQLAHAQPEWYLPTGDGCSIFVQEFGRGSETIVILHGGWGAEHSYMLDPFKGLEEKYHLVFYDQRGSLLSPCPVDKISVQKHVDDLERLRSVLGLTQINIVAHSMGTFLALEYLQQHPERVKGIVLLGVLPPRTPKTDAEKKLLEEQQSASQLFVRRSEIETEVHRLGLDKPMQTLTPQQETSLWRIHFAGASIYHIDRWRQVKGGKAFYKSDAAQAAAKTMPQQWDFTDALAARHCPTWAINGDHDYADPGGKIFQMATANIPTVHVTVIRDAGHVSWIDAPVEFSKAFSSALRSTTKCSNPSQ